MSSGGGSRVVRPLHDRCGRPFRRPRPTCRAEDRDDHVATLARHSPVLRGCPHDAPSLRVAGGSGSMTRVAGARAGLGDDRGGAGRLEKHADSRRARSAREPSTKVRGNRTHRSLSRRRTLPADWPTAELAEAVVAVPVNIGLRGAISRAAHVANRRCLHISAGCSRTARSSRASSARPGCGRTESSARCSLAPPGGPEWRPHLAR